MSIESSGGKKKKSGIHFVAGGISGAAATILAQPLDVIKTRMIGCHNPSVMNTIQSIVASSSTSQVMMSKLWKGTTPAMARIVPAGMIYFGSVHVLKKNFANRDLLSMNDNTKNFIIGATARSIATAITCPLMIVKTKFEYSTDSSATIYETMKQLGRNRSLFSGLIPSIVRDVPYSGSFLLIYEYCKKEMDPLISNRLTLSLTSATIAGSLATIITQPFDVVRTHIQINAAQRDPANLSVVQSNGVTGTMRNVMGSEGILGLFRGVCPRIVKRSLSSAISWSVYESVVRLYECGSPISVVTTTETPGAIVTSRVEKSEDNA